MITSNKINIIVAAAVVFALITSFALVGIGSKQAETGGMKSNPEYAEKIFGNGVVSIEIIANEADWQYMLDNAISEQFIMADVIVNGKKFQNVGIRPKGNSSLTQVASSGSDRYSFRLQFDEYIKGQTCFGLESFVLNNMLGDNTYMKEYISYDLMREAGVDAPYFGYADIRVNGESWGLYLAVELYNDSYEQRVFGNISGMLYNVKSMDMGGNDGANRPGGQGGNMPGMPDISNFPNIPNMPNVQDMPNMPNRPDMSNIPNMPNMPNMPEMPNGIPQMPFGGQFQRSPGFQRNPQNNNGEQPVAPPDDDVMPGSVSPPDTVSQEFPSENPSSQDSIPPQNSPRQNSPQRSAPQQNTPQWSFPQQNFPPQTVDGNRGIGRNFGGRGGWGSSGGSLEYIDHNIESYGAIFNNVVGKGTESDYRRVVQALKALSEGRELEKYFDVDRILRYLAAHTIVVNLDSYSSGMAQNYYIYESDGRITILPWDYNLAWGGFQNGSASSVINFPIDTPVSGVEMSSRPLIDKLFANEEYLERYHSYLQQLIDNYFANGKFEEKVNALDALISDHVKNDPTAFCTYEEYKTAVSTFITLGSLRAQSVQGQLDGTVPSTAAEQNSNPSKLIPAGDLKLSDLGSMMGGRGGNNMNFPGGIGGWFGGMQQNGGQVNPFDNFGRMRQGRQNSNSPNRFDGGVWSDQGQNTQGQRTQGLRTNNLILTGALSLVLIAAIIFAARYKKSYYA